MRECCIGRWLVLEEPNGEATVYDEDRPDWRKDFGSYDEAVAWAGDPLKDEEA